jgi:hypothetical protein
MNTCENIKIGDAMNQIRMLCLIAGLILPNTAWSANEPSPLHRTAANVRDHIASSTGCTWHQVTENIFRCGGPLPEDSTWIGMTILSDDSIDYIEFAPSLGENRDRAETPEGKAEQAATLRFMESFFSDWKDARQWLSDAMRRSRTKMFQTSIRVQNTSIYVREAEPANRDVTFALVILTLKKDLTEFKKFKCEDNEQGPSLDSCARRDADTPRPPDNPILHLD